MEVEAPIEPIGDRAKVALGILAEAEGMVRATETDFDVYEVSRPLYLQGESPCSTNCSFRWIGWGRVGAVMGRLNLPRQCAEKAYGKQ